MTKELTIKDLKKLVLTSKKESREISQAYANIVKQVESQTVGVKNPETDEKKLIISACKKELKEQEQSKVSGAPYSPETIMICTSIIEQITPKLMTERETEVAVDAVIFENEGFNMGQIMGEMKKQYGDKLDMVLLSKIVKGKTQK